MPQIIVLTYVPFDDRPSGSIAMMALRSTALKYVDEYPQASQFIVKNSYVDDILASVKSLDVAKQLMKDVEFVLYQGGFKVKHWKISGEEHEFEETVTPPRLDKEKVLGVVWHPRADCFSFEVKINFYCRSNKVPVVPKLTPERLQSEMPQSMTMRLLLSQIASQYDPLGLIAPVTLRGKLMMRDLVGRGSYGWDDVIPAPARTEWLEYFTSLFTIEQLHFPRAIKPKIAIGHPTIIVFSDSSSVAFGTCAYIRWDLSDETFFSQLLMAKTRLAPLRQLTIPRLELCGALVGARLRETIEKEMTYSFARVFHATDSAIVSAQIQKESYGFGTFTATRVAEIQAKTYPDEWWWVPGEMNPADLLTRVTRPEELQSNSTWQRGPEFLSRSIDEWPLRKDPVEDLPDRIEVTVVHTRSVVENVDVIDVNKFSSFKRMMRVTSRVLNALKNKSFGAISIPPSVDDLVTAENWWIRRVQATLHPDWENHYCRLGPVLRKDGIVAVGERIPKWLKDNYNQCEYILLPPDHPFTRLYVRHAHEINHSGIGTTLAKMQTRFWIPTVRKIIRSVKERFTYCRRLRKVTEGQIMGQLPTERLKPSPPFMNTALDLFGPFMVKDTVKRCSRRKGYGVIFNCLSTRATYIDLVEGYGTKEFLNAFRRFCSVHGYPSKVFSDRGTQLASANKELGSIIAN